VLDDKAGRDEHHTPEYDEMLLVEALLPQRGPDNSTKEEYQALFQDPRRLLKDALLDSKVSAVLEVLGTFYTSVAEVVEKTNQDQVGNRGHQVMLRLVRVLPGALLLFRVGVPSLSVTPNASVHSSLYIEDETNVAGVAAVVL